MSSIKDKIAKIYKDLFQEDIKNEQLKLKDGTIIDADSFEVGSEVFKINEDGTKTPLTDGDYTLEDGRIITIAGGKIDTITEVDTTPNPDQTGASSTEPVVENLIPDPTIENKFEEDTEKRLKAIEDFIESIKTNKELSDIVNLIDKLSLNVSKIDDKIKILEKQPIGNLTKTKEVAQPKVEKPLPYLRELK